MKACLLPLALVACRMETSTRSGTSVGNPTVQLDPGQMAMRVAPSTALDLAVATLDMDRVDLSSCDGDDASVGVGDELDLAGSDALEIAGGSWCSVTVVPAGTLWLEGTGELGNSYVVELDLGQLQLRPPAPWEVDDTAAVLELAEPEWLASVAALLALGSDVELHPSDIGHDALVDLVQGRSGLFHDADGDGVLDDGEREAGALAAGEERGEEFDDD